VLDRRTLLTGLAAGVASPAAALAQPSKIARIGVVSAGGRPYVALLQGLREGLKALGLEDGAHYTLDVKETGGEIAAAEQAGRDFERQGLPILFAMPSSVAVGVKQATSRVSIVFVAGSDPIEVGLVESLARPGGRLTGVHSVTGDLLPKHLQLLKEMVPALRRVLTFYNPDNAAARRSIRAARDAARRLGVEIVESHVRSVADIRVALPKLTRKEVDGYVFTADALITSHADLIVQAALAQGLPAITIYREAVVDGALASYGAPFGELGRIAARPLQRVMTGTRPGDIPVQAYDRVSLVVNAKAAKRLGLTIPQSVLLRADEVIEQ
jgi:putative ABC transport system substrate-binding protein